MFYCVKYFSISIMRFKITSVYPVPVIYDEARFARVIERSHHSQ